MLGNFARLLLSSDFFQHLHFKKQSVWIQIRPDIMSGLIWVQTVCNGYQEKLQILSADNTSRQRVKVRNVFFIMKSINESEMCYYSKTCLKPPLKKKTKNWFSRLIIANAGQKYCRMPQEGILQYF